MGGGKRAANQENRTFFITLKKKKTTAIKLEGGGALKEELFAASLTISDSRATDGGFPINNALCRLVEIANSFEKADGFYVTATWMFVRYWV